VITSDPLPSAGCAGDLEPDTGCVEGSGEKQASESAAVDAEGAGCAAVVDDKPADAEPERPTRRKAESVLRSIGYTRREAETIMRAGLTALTDSAPTAHNDQLNVLLQLFEERDAVVKGKPS
jgi:hypothetical protein